jgi:hypothetical protein
MTSFPAYSFPSSLVQILLSSAYAVSQDYAHETEAYPSMSAHPLAQIIVVNSQLTNLRNKNPSHIIAVMG